jgi:hypothetical protein
LASSVGDQWLRRLAATAACAPDRVHAATENYLTAEDALGEFLDVRVAQEIAARVPSADLYSSYLTFAKSRGEDVGSIKEFGVDLEGFVRKRGGQGVVWLGMRLADKRIKSII